MTTLDPYIPVIGNLGVALINSVGLVLVGYWAYTAKRNSKVAVSQLENDHGDSENPNLRVDLDAKFESIESSVEKVHRGNDRIMSKLSVVEGDVSLLKEGYVSNRQRIESIEDTAAQEREQKRLWGPPPETRRDRRGRDAR